MTRRYIYILSVLYLIDFTLRNVSFADSHENEIKNYHTDLIDIGSWCTARFAMFEVLVEANDIFLFI